jgi:SAM-dependent methyltransferase
MIARDIVATETSWEIWRTTRGAPLRDMPATNPSAVDGCNECGTLWRCRDREAAATGGGVLLVQHHGQPGDGLDEIHRRRLLDLRADRTWLSRQGIVPGARLLDVACQSGALLQFAVEQGALPTGLDTDEHTVAFSRSLGLDVRMGTLDSSDFGAPFDGVWMLDGFEQMPEPQRVLRSVRAQLRTGGRVVIRTPNADFARVAYEPTASSYVSIAARLHQVWGLPFVHCYTPDALRVMLTATGFDDIRFRARPPAGSARVSNAIIEDAAVAPLAPWIDVTAIVR